MATPAWVRDRYRHEFLTAKLIRTDQATQALERAVNLVSIDEAKGMDGSVIRSGMSFADE